MHQWFRSGLGPVLLFLTLGASGLLGASGCGDIAVAKLDLSFEGSTPELPGDLELRTRALRVVVRTNSGCELLWPFTDAPGATVGQRITTVAYPNRVDILASNVGLAQEVTTFLVYALPNDPSVENQTELGGGCVQEEINPEETQTIALEIRRR